jgi:protein-disulfide isomerase
MKNLVLLLLGCGVLACAAGQVGRGKQSSASGAQAGASPSEGSSAKQSEQGKVPAALAPAAAASDHGAAAVPVTAQDPTWGNPDAPVTIVEFSDFQCPFCSRIVATMEELKRSYGPEQLRLVWKNFPLSFHANARPAAEAAMTAFALGGSQAFWTFHDLVFANQRELGPNNFATWAGQAGLSQAEFSAALAAGRGKAKVDADRALAGGLRITGTPTFLINGVSLAGAQPTEKFKELIDAQLAAGKALVASGLAAHAVYPALCAKNLGGERAAPAEDAEKEDTTLWNVPVEKDDPVRGPADALVTLVVFSDFQCSFCQRLEATLTRLREKYGRELRIVWKDRPLPFHQFALPAAVLARVAQEKKGVDGFWQAHDAIFNSGAEIDLVKLETTAAQLGISFNDVARAMEEDRYQPLFDAGEELSQGLDARGTPTSFVNGYRVTGAVPFERFVAVVDAQRARAKAMVDAGQARATLYQALAKAGKEAKGQERKQVDAPTDENPSKGVPDAKVTVQIFSDFQCPYCAQVRPTLAQLEKKFSGRIRFVWRNFPLPFHAAAPLAAEAAQEVFVQKGATGFWKYHDLLFAMQGAGELAGELERPTLERLAKKLGLDMRQFRAALDSRRHKAVVDRDVAAANKAEIRGTPAFVIGGYFVSGAQPVRVFERVVSRALAEAQ